MAKKTSSSSSNSKGKAKIHKVMKEKKEGTLKSGSGKKVTSRKQAIAIALSEARRSGAKIPKKKGAAKKGTAKKGAAKKSTTKKAATKKKATARKKSK